MRESSFQYCNHMFTCSVQLAVGHRHSETTVKNSTCTRHIAHCHSRHFGTVYDQSKHTGMGRHTPRDRAAVMVLLLTKAISLWSHVAAWEAGGPCHLKGANMLCTHISFDSYNSHSHRNDALSSLYCPVYVGAWGRWGGGVNIHVHSWDSLTTDCTYCIRWGQRKCTSHLRCRLPTTRLWVGAARIKCMMQSHSDLMQTYAILEQHPSLHTHTLATLHYRYNHFHCCW